MNLKTPSQRKYTDIRNSFKTHPLSKDLLTISGDDSVKQSIQNLILTQTEEKPFHPEISSGIHNLLFEPISDVTTRLLEKSIEDVISMFDPRVLLEGVVATPNEEKNSYQITVIYTLVNNPQPVQVQELSFFIERRR